MLIQYIILSPCCFSMRGACHLVKSCCKCLREGQCGHVRKESAKELMWQWGYRGGQMGQRFLLIKRECGVRVGDTIGCLPIGCLPRLHSPLIYSYLYQLVTWELQQEKHHLCLRLLRKVTRQCYLISSLLSITHMVGFLFSLGPFGIETTSEFSVQHMCFPAISSKQILCISKADWDLHCTWAMSMIVM